MALSAIPIPCWRSAFSAGAVDLPNAMPSDTGCPTPPKLKNLKDGDIIIAHMNKPRSDYAEGLAVGLIQLLRSRFVFFYD
jgi:hypothetical protein